MDGSIRTTMLELSCDCKARALAADLADVSRIGFFGEASKRLGHLAASLGLTNRKVANKIDRTKFQHALLPELGAQFYSQYRDSKMHSRS